MEYGDRTRILDGNGHGDDVDTSETTPLICVSTRIPKWRLKRYLIGGAAIFSILILIIFLCVWYFILRRTCVIGKDCIALNIVALNCWGMPISLGSKDKAERIEAIGKLVGAADYDLFLLEELWMEPDYEVIKGYTPKGFSITNFRDLALSSCDGHLSPAFCSGLTIISRYEFIHKEFNSYTYHGDFFKMTIDGEYIARKGVGLVRIIPASNFSAVDVFITHTAADPPAAENYSNSYYRRHQVAELMDFYIDNSKSDFVILGGDFNMEPNLGPGEPYAMVRASMHNSIEDFFYVLQRWLNPKHATYGNDANTWSFMEPSVIIDYIFYKTNADNVSMWTNWFEVLLLKFLSPHNQSLSLSDHEAVRSRIYLQLDG